MSGKRQAFASAPMASGRRPVDGRGGTGRARARGFGGEGFGGCCAAAMRTTFEENRVDASGRIWDGCSTCLRVRMIASGSA
jgi:hypothetical protein